MVASSKPIACLKINNSIITEDKEKADILADRYDSMSKTSNQSLAFQIIKATEEEKFKISLPDLLADSNANLNLNNSFHTFRTQPGIAM